MFPLCQPAVTVVGGVSIKNAPEVYEPDEEMMWVAKEKLDNFLNSRLDNLSTQIETKRDNLDRFVARSALKAPLIAYCFFSGSPLQMQSPLCLDEDEYDAALDSV